MLLPNGKAYDFAPLKWSRAALFQQNLLSLYHHGNKSSGYEGLALRQPTICFPILSISRLNSAYFFIDNIFISTQRRISNFNNSKSSRNASRCTLFSFALFALYILLTSCMLSLFTRYVYTPVENLWCIQKFSIQVYKHL